MRPGSRLVLVGVVALALAGGPVEGVAQDSLPPLDARGEARLLREATAQEAAGDYRGAQRTLEELLERKPTSAGALFALERVLRAQGRPAEVLGHVDAFLEEDPTANPAHHLKLRLLAEADSLKALEEAGRVWMDADPSSVDPYREVARVFQGPFGPERALEVLRRGTATLSDSTELAVELGDLLIQVGDPEGAVRAWDLALRGEAAQITSVLRRLKAGDRSRDEVAAGLIDRLAARPTTLPRRRAAVRLAVEMGLTGRTLELARGLVPGLSPRARAGFLAELARRAEERGSGRVALWAYTQARDEVESPEQAMALDVRIAETALALGDTALAVEARDRAARTLPEGSLERRRALAASVRLQVAGSDLKGARGGLEGFRREFPDAPELDGLAAALARRFSARGRSEAAGAVLEGVTGPRSALERGFLALGGGDPAGAREHLTRALQGLDPGEATEIIQLLSLLDRTSEESRGLVGRVAALGRDGDPGRALGLMEEELPGLPEADLPGLLAMGARLARAGGMPTRAAGLRERLIRDFPEAPETPEAMLRQARWHARGGMGPERARELLERLIVERPESPVVPEARRELQRLKEGKG